MHKGKHGFTTGQVTALLIAWLVIFVAITTHAGSKYTGKSSAELLSETIMSDPDVDKPDPEQQGFENDQIESALLAKANKIENCTVTWYTNDTCGKTPANPSYRITASGEPTATHCTVATDPSIIPTGSDVCVQYADGATEWFRATDTGVSGTHVDIFTDDYQQAINNGVQLLTVWYIPPMEEDVN